MFALPESTPAVGSPAFQFPFSAPTVSAGAKRSTGHAAQRVDGQGLSLVQTPEDEANGWPDHGTIPPS